jgi:hypothetical protein
MGILIFALGIDPRDRSREWRAIEATQDELLLWAER